MSALQLILSVVLVATGSLPLAAQDVGYYDMATGQGNATQVPSIVAAGGTPVLIFDLSPAELAGIDVLYVQNPSNTSFGSEYLANLPNIDAAVTVGLVLLVHDRYVTNASSILPGGIGITAVRNTSDDIDFQDTSTLVSNGPGGILNDTDLDGGGSSCHGYLDSASLPGGAVNIIERALAPTQIVLTSYFHGSGSVVYSTIPLDYFLAGLNDPNMSDIYAPNVVAYAMELFLERDPILEVTQVIPGQFITLNATRLGQGSRVAFVVSSLGPGPTPTPFGVLEVSSPFRVTPLFPADVNGEFNFTSTLPMVPTLFMQSVVFLEDGSTQLTNPLQVVIP